MPNQTINYFVSLIKQTDKLKKTEKEILIKRLRQKTLKKIGRQYKKTGERIRQIEKTAIIKLVKKIYQPILINER